ncbi:MAG: hypothetical protein QUU85_01075, partial [Candidatus Eisenbacteria bacterium]|nr:hypothetical protein [Candidatus Eisenbacteria bacterium]
MSDRGALLPSRRTNSVSSLVPLRRALLVAALLTGVAAASPAASFDGSWFDTRFGKPWDLRQSTEEILVRYDRAASSLDREIVENRYG